MNWEQVEGKWKEFKGMVRENWGKLTDDDLERIAGKKDRLIGRLEATYGLKKENAEADIDRWLSGVGESQGTVHHHVTHH